MSTDTPLKDAARKPSTLLPPQQRLEASRTSLRVAMQPHAPATASGMPRGLIGRLKLASSSVDGVLAHPVVGTLRDTARHWWTTHPWRPAIVIGLEAVNQLAVPVARKHPLRLLGVAMLGGAVLSRLKPWKWLLKSAAPALVASMLPALMSRLATRIPVSTLIKAFGKPADGRNESAVRSSPASVRPSTAERLPPAPR